MTPALRCCIAAALMGALLPAAAWAETGYVTDSLLVGVHAKKDLNSSILKILPTGTPLEILGRDGDFTRVRTPDGTIGWVDASYLMSTEPAVLKLRNLEQQQAKTEAALAAARAEVKHLQAELAQQTSASTAPTPTGAEPTAAPPAVTAPAAAARAAAEPVAATTTPTGSTATGPTATGSTDVLASDNGTKQAGAAVVRPPARASATHIPAEGPKTESAAAAAPATPTAAARAAQTEPGPRPQAAPSRAADEQPGSPEAAARSMVKQVLGALRAELDGTYRLPPLQGWQWLLIGSVLLLVFALGAYVMDWRNRRRHGGFRL